MRLVRTAALALLCILPFAVGCRPAAPPAAPQPTGSIEGSITFTGLQPSTASGKASLPPDCRAGVEDRHLILEDRMLPRSQPQVFLWISNGLPHRTFAPPHEQAVLTQILCRFQPQILGVLPGQPVDFTNGDPFPAHFRIAPRVAGNPTLQLTLPPQKPGQVHAFPHPELMIPVTSPRYPHARAYINVVPNPHFTLSGPQGHFRLRHLPPGTYTLSAIQPGYPAQSQSVTVKPHAATQVSFTFSPPAPASPQPSK